MTWRIVGTLIVSRGRRGQTGGKGGFRTIHMTWDEVDDVRF